MVLSNVIVDVTIRRRYFVFGHSRLLVSPMYQAWQSQHLILYTAPCLSSGLSLSLTLGSCRRKVVISLCTVTYISTLQYTCCMQTDNHFTANSIAALTISPLHNVLSLPLVPRSTHVSRVSR